MDTSENCSGCGQPTPSHNEGCVEQNRQNYYGDVKAISETMAMKFERNLFKPDPLMNPDGEGRRHEHLSEDFFLDRMRGEMKEIEEALEAGDLEGALKECADVANFAVMLYGKIRRKL